MSVECNNSSVIIEENVHIFKRCMTKQWLEFPLKLLNTFKRKVHITSGSYLLPTISNQVPIGTGSDLKGRGQSF